MIISCSNGRKCWNLQGSFLPSSFWRRKGPLLLENERLLATKRMNFKEVSRQYHVKMCIACAKIEETWTGMGMTVCGWRFFDILRVLIVKIRFLRFFNPPMNPLKLRNLQGSFLPWSWTESSSFPSFSEVESSSSWKANSCSSSSSTSTKRKW